MHIVLIHPPQGIATGRKPNINAKPYHFPPGILSLAAACEAAGDKTEILDFPMNEWKLTNFENWLKNNAPDIIGISFCSPSISFVERLAITIRHYQPKTKIVLGGPHVSFDPSPFLLNHLADYIVRQEGETSFVQLVRCLEHHESVQNVSGISYLFENSVINTPAQAMITLDSLPMPSYHLLDMSKYKSQLNRMAVASMRGCPFGCKFCTITPLMGNKARVRSENKLLNELMLLKNTYDISRVSFTDPNFALSKPRLEKLLCLFNQHDFSYQFGCQTRLFTLTDEVLLLLKELGCLVVFVGIESGSSKMLTHYNKDKESKQEMTISKMIEKIKHRGFEIIPSFIIGSPEETLEDIHATMTLAKKIISGFDLKKQKATEGGNFQINMFGPFPGVTENSQPLEIPIEFAPAIPVCGTKHVSRETLKKIWHSLYQEFNPEFYKQYCEIEEAAERGINLYLQNFIQG